MHTTKSLLIAAALATAATLSFAQAPAPVVAPAAPAATMAPAASTATAKPAKTMKAGKHAKSTKKPSKKHVAKGKGAKAAPAA